MTHTASVREVYPARYPFVPSCTCGWKSRGYVSALAAEFIADDHAATEHATDSK